MLTLSDCPLTADPNSHMSLAAVLDLNTLAVISCRLVYITRTYDAIMLALWPCCRIELQNHCNSLFFRLSFLPQQVLYTSCVTQNETVELRFGHMYVQILTSPAKKLV